MKTKHGALVIIWLLVAVLTVSIPLSPTLALDAQQTSEAKPVAPEPPKPLPEAQPPPGWQPSSISSRGIQELSDLTQVNNPADWPYSAVVRLHMTWPTGGTGTCSGVLIDPRHVLTAGHCVFDYNDPERAYEPCPVPSESCWAAAIEIVPAYENGNAPFGKAHMIRPMSWTAWTGASLETKNYAHDMGVIYLDRPVGALTGWYGYGAGDNDFFLDNEFWNSGYPGADKSDGQTMWTRKGQFDTSGIYQAGHTNLSYSGQSGSGYAYRYVPDQDLWRAYAITSHYHQEMNESTVTYCPKITYLKLGNIIEWIDEHTPTQPDLVPLNVEVNPTSVDAGQPISVSFLLHNYSSSAWNSTLSIHVYLSADSNISDADELLYTEPYQGQIGAKSWIRRHIPQPLTIPEGREGAYYIGVLIDIADSNTVNNATAGWDAARINLTQAKLKSYVPYVIRGFDPENTTLISDDFSDPNSGWTMGETADYQMAYTDGEYQVRAKHQDSVIVSTAPVQCANCSIEVDARFEGTTNKGYGLVFAQKGDDYYGFLAFPYSGICDLVKFSADNAELLSRDNCDLPPAVNHLRVEWQTPAIRTYVNEALIQDVTDDAFEGVGDIGVITYFEGDARFDNFVAASLPQGP